MKKVIYIASLSHSGSTLLDLLLSHHKDVLGLGEVVNVLHNKKKTGENTEAHCSCGAKLEKCSFWSGYKAGEEDDATKYEKILKIAKKKVIVDSSKNLPPLEYLQKLHKKGKIKLQVIFLLKDMRGWAVSTVNAEKRWGKKAKPHFYYFLPWYIRNRKIQKYLSKNKIEYTQIGYDELCFNTDLILNKIFDFAGLPKAGFSLQNKPATHIAYGNRMKLKGKTEIQYDNRWFNNFWLNASAAAFFPIFHWNKKNTYSNTNGRKNI